MVLLYAVMAYYSSFGCHSVAKKANQVPKTIWNTIRAMKSYQVTGWSNRSLTILRMTKDSRSLSSRVAAMY
jgi:hypothetical protein